MKSVMEEGHLRDLISKVETLSRLRNALPSKDVMSDEMLEEYNKIAAQEFEVRVAVYDWWKHLVKEGW
ncbi:hypothetical protein VPHG_00199 [Vibrio phage 11895-B1]|uniref:hypothetical protein n=1 Tax=Vibrio phage 11895-B1 TaxID=754075 RepID=UPI0002C10327|nr:hypothetical protein VPHG_00199 [Vibrio phage 11895-B1]AGH32262.1 hypothetical protein VPHG_00199 [Vibrio phage 11895-B1]